MQIQQKPGVLPAYEKIPEAARLPCQGDTLWINNRGDTIIDRQVIGDRVLVRQQPASPPLVPQVLVLADQMLQANQPGDKYMKILAMSGYSLPNYTQDI